MANSRTHKFEIIEPGNYILMQEEYLKRISNSVSPETAAEVEFLKHLGVEVFSIGFLIKYFREKRGLSLRDLDEKTGIPYSQLSRYENDKALPEPNSIDKLFQVLGSSFEISLKIALQLRDRTRGT